MKSTDLDTKVLEVVYDLLRSMMDEIEERLFFPKRKDNVIDIKMGDKEAPF
jgi:hypothetical protein